MSEQNFDCIAVGAVDFKTHKTSILNYHYGKFREESLLYDLASITKPFTLSFSYLKDPSIFNKRMLWLLNHRGGVPAWGRLARGSWKQTLMNYTIIESDTSYSDLGALRLMLELEGNLARDLKSYVSPLWDAGIKFWKDIEKPQICVDSGSGTKGTVHDPNAQVINEFASHAGLFGTIDGVLRTLLNVEDKHSMLKVVEENIDPEQRFVLGFDRATGKESLACSEPHEKIIGHLGFTGTCFWIDLEAKKGFAILSNGTVNHWFSKDNLNILRREVGQLLLESDV